MILVKAVVVLCMFLVIPYFWGMFFATEDNSNIATNVLCGYALIYAVFQIISIPCTFLKTSFNTLCYSYVAILLIGVIVSIIRCRRSIAGQIKKIHIMPFKENWMIYLVLLLVLLQTIIAVVMTHMDLDDSVFVGTATTTLFGNRMYAQDTQIGWSTYGHFPIRYVLAPFPMLLAVYSKLSQFHPAVMAHTIMPAFFIPLSYVAYYLVGKKLFGKNKDSVAIFLGLVAIVQMFSYYSVYTQSTFILIRSWQGKAFLAGVLLPAIFALCMNFAEKKIEKKFWLLLCAFMVASSMVSSMGIMLAPMAAGIFCLIYGVFRKRWGVVWRVALVCVPNMILAVVYVILR